MATTFIPLDNTTISLPTESHTVSDLDPNQVITFGINLARRTFNGQTVFEYANDIINGVHTNYITREQFVDTFGAEESHLDAAQNYYESLGLQTVNRSQFGAALTLSGTVSQINSAFNTSLNQINLFDNSYMSYSGPLCVPDHLEGIVLEVSDLHDPVEFRPHIRSLPDDVSTPASSATSLTPKQVAKAYNFPNISGSGVCVGIIELGGGYNVSDVNSSFAAAGITPPTMVDISVSGGSNNIGDTGSNGEVNLDIYVAGGVAPGCKLAMYFVPNGGLYPYRDAINDALADTTNNPTSISISWGIYEGGFSGRFIGLFSEGAMASAASMGIPVCVSSGDYGSSGQSNTTAGGCQYPAASAYSLSVGGTSLLLNGDGSINSEVVWNQGNAGSGGGPAAWIGNQSWQNGLNYTPYPGGSPTTLGSARWTPDVAANGDPTTGYNFISAGSQLTNIGGTSAAAPLWAGMLALFSKSLGKPVGFLNPLLYSNTNLLNDITSGNNACPASTGYSATSGWDACTGLGTPKATALLNQIIASSVTINLSPTSISNLQVGVATSNTITASGGTSPYTFAVTSGSLPPGISLSTTGSTTCLLSGTPTTAGSYSFTITATDANNNKGNQAYSTNVIANPPVTANVSQTVPFNSTSNITLSITGTVFGVQVNSQASHGTATASGTNISYTSNTGYYGPDSFTYTANNAGGISNISTASITVLPALPVTSNVSQTVPYNITSNIALSITGVVTNVQVVSPASHGVATAVGNTISYTPTTNYYGSDSFTYTANNATGTSNISTVNLTILPSLPVTANVSQTVPFNSVNNQIVLSITGVVNSVQANTQPLHGVATAIGTNIFYTPNTGYSGSDSFKYTANNIAGYSNASTVSITVPTPPVTANVSKTFPYNSINDVINLNISGTFTNLVLNTLPSNGSAILINSQILYTPNSNFYGTDTFTYSANNSGSISNISTVNVTIPKPPVTQDSVQSCQINSSNNLIVLQISGPYTGVSIVTNPSNGNISVVGTLVFYAPNTDYHGLDNFTYTANNLGSISNISKVQIDVLPLAPLLPQLKFLFRRGTHAQTASFTGASGEIVIDTDNHTTSVHDGKTLGGHYIVKQNDLISIFNQLSSNLANVSLVANAAYNTANIANTISIASSNYSNTWILEVQQDIPEIFAIDNTQNTNINIVSSTTSNANSICDLAVSTLSNAIVALNISGNEANSAFLYANNSFNSVNSYVTYFTTLDKSQNTSINMTRSLIQSAFDKANTIPGNSAYLTSLAHSQALFNDANSALYYATNIRGGSF